MSTRAVQILTVAGLLSGTAALAQTVVEVPAGDTSAKYLDQANGLSLDDAVQRALDREPTLRATRADVAAARGLLVQAGLRPNPTVSFSQVEEPGGRDRQTRLEMVWPLDLFRRPGRLGVADRAVEVARHEVADRERQLAADVRQAYGAVAAELHELAILEDLIRTVSEQHELISARVDQGIAPPLDRDLLRVDLQRLDAERFLRLGLVEQAVFALKRSLGVAADAPLRIRDALEPLVARELSVDLAAPEAPSGPSRPDVEAAEARLELTGAEIDRARREGRPDVSLFGGYMRMEGGFPQRAFGAGTALEPIHGVFHYLSAGAMVTVPVRDRKQGEAAAAEARQVSAVAALEAARLDAATEIAAARSRDEHARGAVAVYSSSTRSLARSNLDVVRQTYHLGRATILDVLSEQRRYLDTERGFAAALREAWDARQALRRALGDVR